MDILEKIFWIAIIILTVIIIYEYALPSDMKEGFESKLVSASSSPFWSNFAPRRGDIGPGYEDEEAGYQRNPRYFQGYVDVQRLGTDHDFCRVITKENTNGKEDLLVACALAGTDGLSSIQFKSESQSEGLRTSRDDYMRDVNGDGRSDYCRILKTDDGQWQPLCRESTDTGFRSEDTVDPEPPQNIQTLIKFYGGCLWWFRFADDMLDYTNNLIVSRGNGVSMDEKQIVRVQEMGAKAEGVQLDGSQFLRIGEPGDLEFGSAVRMRTLRAFCLWVYVDEFTNNAKFFDFGNGAGKDNIWLGIGKPTEEASADEPLKVCESTIPAWPAGPQAPVEQDPQTFMKTSAANVDEYECLDTTPETEFELARRKIMKPSKTADLIYEVWDSTQRAMRIKISNVIPQGRWVHITVTAKDTKSFRPDLNFYIDGKLVRTKESGFLPQTDYMARNYIGKSNWSDVTSMYQDKDELFKGRIFDFRGYTEPIKKPVDIYSWGKKILQC
jgi:hypothetical protein